MIWSDVFDLATGSSASLGFSATTSLPVGSTLYNVALAGGTASFVLSAGEPAPATPAPSASPTPCRPT